jgi:hypothetical protein
MSCQPFGHATVAGLSSLKQMTQDFSSYVKQLSLYTNTTSTTDFEGKRKQKKKNKEVEE